MANDIDMWADLDDMDKRTTKYKILFNCYLFRFIEPNYETANKWKEVYLNLFNDWGNYY